MSTSDGEGGRVAAAAVTGAGEVLVRVTSTSFNGVDAGIRGGWLQGPFPVALPHTPGADVAGTVEALGEAGLQRADFGVAHGARGQFLDDVHVGDLNRLLRGGEAADLLRADHQRVQRDHVADDVAGVLATPLPNHDAVARHHVVRAENARHGLAARRAGTRQQERDASQQRQRAQPNQAAHRGAGVGEVVVAFVARRGGARRA